MPRQNCRRSRDMNRARAEAEAAARAIIAQGRSVAAQAGEARAGAEAAMEAEEPMNRYIYPLPVCDAPAACPAVPCGCEQETLERILEVLSGQNQLLVDILGAINSLTAAMLAAQCRR